MNMNEILVTIALVTFIAYAVFNIIYLIDLRKTSVTLRQFIAKTEENLNPALIELRLMLEDIRKVSDNASSFLNRVGLVLTAIISLENNIRSVYGYYKEGLGQAAQANIAGVKAGVRAGVVNFIKKMKDKKEAS